MKCCKHCGEMKSASDFFKESKAKDGLRTKCKVCEKECYQQRYAKNREKIIKNVKKWQAENTDKVTKYKQKWEKNNADYKREYSRRYARENSEARKEYSRYFRKNNLEYERNRELQRKQNDFLYRIAQNYRCRVATAFKRNGFSKNTKTAKMLGCDFKELIIHLECQFSSGMTWENYGSWHIDHIVPLSFAKTEDELMDLCHYSNLQPLWAEDNLKKNKKLV